MSFSQEELNNFEGPGYTVVLQQVFREHYCMEYSEGPRTIKLLGDRVFLGEQIDFSVPDELSSEDTPRVLQNIAVALAKMRLEYVIYRTHVDPVSEEDRKAAIAALLAIGFKAEPSEDGSVVLKRIAGSFPNTGSPTDLAQLVSGRRIRREVLCISAHAEWNGN
jgi:hypothetical protein